MEQHHLGVNDDGTPHIHYYNPGGHVVATGPFETGVIELADGTKYDVTAPFIAVDSHEHALELGAIIDERDAARVGAQ